MIRHNPRRRDRTPGRHASILSRAFGTLDPNVPEPYHHPDKEVTHGAYGYGIEAS